MGPEGETAVAVAAKKGRYRVVQALTATRQHVADVPDDVGRTPLSLAAEAGSGEPGAKVTEVLLQTDVVNVESASNEVDTPVQFAVSRGRIPLGRVLVLQGGADLRKAFASGADGNLQLTKRPAK